MNLIVDLDHVISLNPRDVGNKTFNLWRLKRYGLVNYKMWALVDVDEALADENIDALRSEWTSPPIVDNSDLFVNYKVNNDLSLNFSIFNLFDRDNSDIQYAQDYFLAGNQAFGKTFHPALPRHVRLTANWLF